MPSAFAFVLAAVDLKKVVINSTSWYSADDLVHPGGGCGFAMHDDLGCMSLMQPHAVLAGTQHRLSLRGGHTALHRPVSVTCTSFCQAMQSIWQAWIPAQSTTESHMRFQGGVNICHGTLASEQMCRL